MIVGISSSLSFSKPPCSYYSHDTRTSTVCVVERPSISRPLYRQNVGTRVFAVSDLHTDYAENMRWVQNLSSLEFKSDVLLVAGDVAEAYDNFALTMSALKNRFEHVFFVPGNHDLWCRRDHPVDSLEKLDKLLDTCKELGVRVDPTVVEGIGIVPLYSWYHQSFDKEKDIPNLHVAPLEMACKDFQACKWPENLSSGDTSLAEHFDSFNERNRDAIEKIRGTCGHIITFSHFLPRQELCPEKRMLFYPKLPRIIGSDYLERRIRSIHGAEEGGGSLCHVFGHTHFCWDSVIDGIRYIQAPLAYPRERKRNMNGGENRLPFCVYSKGEFSERMSPCHWSDYYSVSPRTPNVTQLAPWVARFYHRT